jgi:hypothetical protein
MSDNPDNLPLVCGRHYARFAMPANRGRFVSFELMPSGLLRFPAQQPGAKGLDDWADVCLTAPWRWARDMRGSLVRDGPGPAGDELLWSRGWRGRLARGVLTASARSLVAQAALPGGGGLSLGHYQAAHADIWQRFWRLWAVRARRGRPPVQPPPADLRQARNYLARLACLLSTLPARGAARLLFPREPGPGLPAADRPESRAGPPAPAGAGGPPLEIGAEAPAEDGAARRSAGAAAPWSDEDLKDADGLSERDKAVLALLWQLKAVNADDERLLAALGKTPADDPPNDNVLGGLRWRLNLFLASHSWKLTVSVRRAALRLG